ncbi:MAG: VCBS repeat-containing protein [Planctomycetes bacterium]|nr:VCBS repeat-containing protein [Planctomycetota bacterium]
MTAALRLALLGALVHPAAAQTVFVDASSALPQTGSFTENVDFADVDLDGDWDAALADGGDFGNDQNRLWINQGGAQGGVPGVFVDATAVALPVLADDSRDVEFADIDADGDQDLFTSNTSHVLNQANRWWVNLGASQGAQLGHYADETASRWIGLGSPGSSLPASSVLASGGFIDWSCDSDFADLDDDGDLDLAQSSYGAAFGGNVPTRLFTNDGTGLYVEFNPTGHQMSTTLLQPGEPGLWCEGLQTPNTFDTSGASCDIATSGLDVDLADRDGDFDVDLWLCARQEAPRWFANRSVENGGTLGFRDLTASAFPAGYWSGSDNMAQEQCDLDGDLDLDLLGVNWPGANELVLVAQPGWVYSAGQQLPSSGLADAEVDAADFDGDGDLDLYAAAFFGSNRLYTNTPAGFSFAAGSGAGAPSDRSLDADAADVDADGDTDVLCAEDAGLSERLRLNVTQIADVAGPRIAGLQTLPAQTAAFAPRSFRSAVLDNANLYTTRYAAIDVLVTVGGCALGEWPARWSGGQLFRAELPGNLLGAIELRVRASDEYGNTTLSAPTSTSGTYAPSPLASFGNGSAGPFGVPQLELLSVPFAGSPFHLALRGLPPSAFALIGLTTQALPTPLLLPGLCELNVAGSLLASKGGPCDAQGCLVWTIALPAGVPSGVTAYAQGFAPGLGVSGNAFAASAGAAITVP